MYISFMKIKSLTSMLINTETMVCSMINSAADFLAKMNHLSAEFDHVLLQIVYC